MVGQSPRYEQAEDSQGHVDIITGARLKATATVQRWRFLRLSGRGCRRSDNDMDEDTVACPMKRTLQEFAWMADLAIFDPPIKLGKMMAFSNLYESMHLDPDTTKGAYGSLFHAAVGGCEQVHCHG
jgi:hypothetical protein